MSNNLINNYFYLTTIKHKLRSRRMRSLREKFSKKRIFVAKPEIKQNNDKVIITVFAFNREKQFLLKKLFFYDRRRYFLNL